MDKIMDKIKKIVQGLARNLGKINKLSLPATIVIASLIIGGFYFGSQVIKQHSIERQQEIKIAQEHKEYVAKRKMECYELYKERDETRSNVDDYFYREKDDICVVIYENLNWKERDPLDWFKEDPLEDKYFTKEY